MALKIVRQLDPITVEQIVAAIYGPPGTGKTSLGFTADDPILLDFDGGVYRSRNRGDSSPIKTWSDAAGIEAEDLEGRKTVIVDTAGRALDVLSTDIIRRDGRMGKGGALTLQGFGRLKAEFTAWLNLLRSFHKDVVLIAHSSEDKRGDDMVERIDAQGSSKQEIYKSADVMGRLSIISGKRFLSFSPTETTFGKNPAQLPALEVPDFAVEPNFLGGVIRKVKATLNEMSEAQRAAAAEYQAAIDHWQARIDQAETPEQFNILLAEVLQTPESIRQPLRKLLWHTSHDKFGLQFDRDSGRFYVPETEAVA